MQRSSTVPTRICMQMSTGGRRAQNGRPTTTGWRSWVDAAHTPGQGIYVRSACAGLAVPRFGCNNIGVVLHSTNHCCLLLKKQAQSDVLRYFKSVGGSSQIRCKMYHVQRHTDKHLCKDQMSPAQKVNVRADDLASSTLMEAVSSQKFIMSLFPTEGISLT